MIRKSFSELCRFTPKQAQATAEADAHQFFLYGGSRGPGKSYWLRWYLLLLLLRFAEQGIRGVRVGLFCEDYPQLTDRQISKITVEFPSWLGAVKTSKQFGFGYHILPKFGGGCLCLRNLDDPAKYQSSEFAAIGVDELTKNPKEKFDTLRGSLRWPGVPRPRFVAATNPGGLGHGWVRALWIERSFPPELLRLAEEFFFLPALPDDNPYLTPDYWEMLESLPPTLARAWRWGEWDVFAGQFFSTWRAQTHVVPAFEIPDFWPIFGSVDYGFNARTREEKPFVYGLYTADPEHHIYRIDELAAAAWDIEKQKSEIARLEARYAQPVMYRVGCPSMFTSQQHQGPTISEMYADRGIGGAVLPVLKPDSDRVSGWARCREWLNDAPDGRPWFMSFDRCNHFNQQVTAVIFDERHPEDIDPNCEDHAVEEWRHLLMSRPYPAQRPEERIDPMSAKAILDEMRGGRRRRRR